ncbi:receptor-like protein 43 [Gossypium hirsutum]|uniref:Receptor-like protein 12 n=1 Tax=Gossypium hirsutum TaxID=3635 RepID=A0A1U8PMH4_GOSHI|nr:receptor-like protein 43 [Gossypium hirsutum]XP_040948774.1 receptor-like protein 43 [Gossypium hirsutum]
MGSHSCSHHEAASLIQFKNSFSITQTGHAALCCDDFASLKSYPKTNSWKEGTDCCSWDGVTCDHLNAHVIALDLSCSWLYSNFPSNTTLFLLPHLQKLNLSFDDFNDSKTPSEFGRFTSFSRSSNLEHLGLSWISFSTELIDSVGNLQALKYLDLSGNSFFQRFSVSITNLSSLEYLIISEANMCGGLPDSMGNLESLKFLDLSSNELSGQIPLSILNLTQLEYLEIARNSLEGSIPDENIAFLDLSSNLICGNLPIPASTIRVFLISNNSFNGEVSSLISNASSLRILDLSHNNLSGTILQCFGDLSNYLEFLNLNKNKFYGTIPPTFAKGCQLSNFQLKWKYVRRAFDTILNCKGLEVLDLGNTKINDTFPHWLGSLPHKE